METTTVPTELLGNIEAMLVRLDRMNDNLLEKRVVSLFASVMSGKICGMDEDLKTRMFLLDMLYASKREAIAKLESERR